MWWIGRLWKEAIDNESWMDSWVSQNGIGSPKFNACKISNEDSTQNFMSNSINVIYTKLGCLLDKAVLGLRFFKAWKIFEVENLSASSLVAGWKQTSFGVMTQALQSWENDWQPMGQEFAWSFASLAYGLMANGSGSDLQLRRLICTLASCRNSGWYWKVTNKLESHRGHHHIKERITVRLEIFLRCCSAVLHILHCTLQALILIMKLLTTCWIALLELFDALSSTPRVGRLNLQEHLQPQLDVPSVDNKHDGHPIFSPPSRPENPDTTLKCDYSAKLDDWQPCSTPDDRGCWLRGPQGQRFDIATNYEKSYPPGTTRKVRI